MNKKIINFWFWFYPQVAAAAAVFAVAVVDSPNPGVGEIASNSKLHSSGASLNAAQIVFSKDTESLPA